MKNDFLLRVFFLLLLSSASALAQRPRTNAQPSPTPVQSTPSAIDVKGPLPAQIAGLSRQISTDLTENQKRTIAVVEFADLRGNVTDFGRFVAEELITRLYETRKFKVIERQLLNKIIAEQKLTLTGIVDPASAQKLGRLLGVDAIASGTVTDLGKTLRINARLIDTTTAEIFAVASIEVLKDDTTAKLNDAESSPDMNGGLNTTPRDRSRSRKVSAQFFTFELHRCRLSGSTVACDLTIVNTDKDRSLAICSGGVIFDEAGNQARMYRARLANDEGHSASSFLISGVPTTARVTFEGVSASANKITLMSLSICSIQGGADFRLEYRNIPLREGAGAGKDDRASDQIDRPRFGQDRTFSVAANQQWTDTRIEVSPGMRIDITASGRIYITDQSSPTNQLLDELIGRRTNTRVPQRTAGTDALVAKILYHSGGESDVLKIGDQKTLVIEDGQSGRLVFGIDDKKVSDNSGYFTVTVKW